MRYYLTQDHFHYDDSGYYGYILFSGTNAELHQLLKDLGRGDQAHGFGWHRWGRSFRPANNGIVYDYYIRLRSKTEVKPSRDVVDEFLRNTLPPRDQALIPSEQALEEHKREQGKLRIKPAVMDDSSASDGQVPPTWVEQLHSQINSLDKLVVSGIEQLTENTVRLGEGLPNLNDQIKELQDDQSSLNGTLTDLLEKLLESHRVTSERLRQELIEANNERLDQQLRKLREQLNPDYNDKVDKSAGLTITIEQLETQLRQEKAAKKRVDDQKAKLESEHEIALKEKDDVIEGLRTSAEESTKKLSRFEKENEQRSSSSIEGRTGDKRRDKDFKEILSGISPNFIFVKGTEDFLYHEVGDYRFVIERLCKIVYEPKYNGRNAIKGGKSGTTKWREDRVGNNDWRLYFCKDSREVGDKIVVFFSTKNDQPEDMDWLRKNPPSNFL